MMFWNVAGLSNKDRDFLEGIKGIGRDSILVET